MSIRLSRLMGRTILLLCVLLPAALALLAARPGEAQPAAVQAGGYRSPYDAAFSPDGRLLAVSDHTAGKLVLLESAGRKVAREVALHGAPAGVAWSADGGSVYVAECGAGTVAEVRAADGSIVRRLTAGRRVYGVAVAPKRQLLVAANGQTDDVSLLSLADGGTLATLPAGRTPQFVAITPDESLAVVGNLLPAGSAMDPSTSAAVTLIDLESRTVAGEVRLPAGSTNLRQLAVTPDGRWALAVHTVGRFTLPTTQLDRGWVNTNALSLIDLSARALLGTVLLDTVTEGAADPWGVRVSPDGATAWITLAGAQQLAQVDLSRLIPLMHGQLGDAQVRRDQRNQHDWGIWARIQKDPARRADLVNDLAALYAHGLCRRVPLPGNGPRGLAVSPDGGTLAVAAHFSGEVLWVHAESMRAEAVALGPDRPDDPARMGERIFHDGTYSFQNWLSCATCHPDGRADGLNWDLLNDGLGNPKNTKSMLLAHATPPAMSHGVRASMEVAAEAGFRFILFRQPRDAELQAVQEYLRALQPAPSPYLKADGQLTDAARRGKVLFESPQTGCATCHPGPLFTDLKLYDVGTRGSLDTGSEFDTPTLVELWRTGPYLHDGSAVDLREVLTTHNRDDRHGKTSHLSAEQIDELVAYLLSL